MKINNYVFFYRLLIDTLTGANIHPHNYINKQVSIHWRKEYFQKKRKWKERNNVNFFLLVKLFVFASFHPPVHPYVRVDN